MPDTQPPTSDYETKRDHILQDFQSFETSYFGAQQAIDTLVQEEVRKAKLVTAMYCLDKIIEYPNSSHITVASYIAQLKKKDGVGHARD